MNTFTAVCVCACKYNDTLGHICLLIGEKLDRSIKLTLILVNNSEKHYQLKEWQKEPFFSFGQFRLENLLTCRLVSRLSERISEQMLNLFETSSRPSLGRERLLGIRSTNGVGHNLTTKWSLIISYGQLLWGFYGWNVRLFSQIATG